MKRVLLYGAIGGALVALLQWIEYKHFIRAYPSEVYGGLLAVIFTAVGIYLGLKWTRPKEVVVVEVKEVRVRDDGPFTLNAEKLKELGITPREHEILGLIAAGLSNREIGEKLFVFPDFAERYAAQVVARMEEEGATAAALAAKRKEMADFAEMYKNPLVNIGFTLLEVFPVGLVMTLVASAILRRKTGPGAPSPAAAVA